jgi:lysophospholipase L1-like esterase
VQTPPNTAPGAATVAATSGPASSLSGAPVLAKSSSWYFLKNVEVDHTRKSAALIALGDSITDGARSTPDTNRRWPDAFAALLGANKKTKAVSVLNVGISGNRILHEGTGPSALDRFDRDVATQPGARFLVITEGINDIGHTFAPPLLPVTAQQVIDGLSEIAKRAHAHGLKVFAGTLSPMGGSKYDAPQTEAMRQAVNAFLRSNTVFDGMIDFDKAVRDPDHPERMLSQLDSGDHLHPSDAGYAAMAAAINLKLFRKR